MLLPQSLAVAIPLVVLSFAVSGTWPNAFKLLRKHKAELVWFDANLSCLVFTMIGTFIFGSIGSDYPLNIMVNGTAPNPPEWYNISPVLARAPYVKIITALCAGMCLGIGIIYFQ